jgi:hypothetical protein
MRVYLFAFICILIGFSSCSKSEVENSTDGIITMEIDGKEWKSDITNTAATISNNIISISGTSGDGSGLTIRLNGTTAKTYSLNQNSTTVAAFAESPTTNSYASNQGNDAEASVIITEINTSDSIVNGTFSFTGFRILDGKKVLIKNGKINNVKLVKPVPVGTGFFKCKINGTQFNGALLVGTVNPFSKKIYIGGSSLSAFPGVYLNLDPDINVGESLLESGFADNTAQCNLSQTEILESVSGIVKISKHDKVAGVIEGTFSFDAKSLINSQTAKITEGSFSSRY